MKKNPFEMLKKTESVESTSSSLERMLAGADEFLSSRESMEAIMFSEEAYKKAKSLVPTGLNSMDIRNFVGHLDRYADSKHNYSLGMYISAMINQVQKSTDAPITLDLRDQKFKLSLLGFRHPRGTLSITGDVGYYFCMQMKGGKVTLKGNCGNSACSNMYGGDVEINGTADESLCGFMCNGEVTLKGSCGERAGQNMKGGHLKIIGSAGNKVGDFMDDGCIEIEGTMVHEGFLHGGELHYNGNTLYYLRKTKYTIPDD